VVIIYKKQDEGPNLMIVYDYNDKSVEDKQ
jgi:hypothetical protein